MTRPYSRPLSATERSYLNVGAQGCNPVIQMCVEGAGSLDSAEVRAAAQVALRANPGLGVVRRGRVWRGAGPGVPPVRHHLVADDDAWLELDCLTEALDVVAGPVLTLDIVESPNATRLLARVSHAVTDGHGLRMWLADLFAAMRGEEPVGAADAATDQHFAASAMSRRTAPPAGYAPAPPMPNVNPLGGTGRTPGEAPRWVRRTFDGRAAGMTARTALAVAASSGGECRVLVPVDLRRHDRSRRSTANLTAQLPIDVHSGETWEDVHGKLLYDLRSNRELAAVRDDYRATNPFANTLDAAMSVGLDGAYPCAAIISDHGSVQPEVYGTEGFECSHLFTLPMLVPYAPMFVSIVRIGERTDVVLACRHTDDAASVDALLDAIGSHLSAPALAKATP